MLRHLSTFRSLPLIGSQPARSFTYAATKSVRFCGFIILVLAPITNAWAWGQEGHSIVAEIAQRRLTPEALAMVEQLLGHGHSLASEASWADDVRDPRPETYNWHFVDIPIRSNQYDPAKECTSSPKGDCTIAELARLRNDLRCAGSDDLKREALKFTVHFIGDLHQPLHTVDEERGATQIKVSTEFSGLKCSKNCTPQKVATNFHSIWDESLIRGTVWDWGAYASRLESGWLSTPEAKGADVGTTLDWLMETHLAAQTIWDQLPPDHVISDNYYNQALPVLDKQLGLAGLRLARFLNEAYASK